MSYYACNGIVSVLQCMALINRRLDSLSNPMRKQRSMMMDTPFSTGCRRKRRRRVLNVSQLGKRYRAVRISII